MYGCSEILSFFQSPAFDGIQGELTDVVETKFIPFLKKMVSE